MVHFLLIVFNVFFIAALAGAVFYSIRSRRQQDPNRRGLYSAKMNMHLGAALVAIGLWELLYPFSITRTIVCSVFILLGLFNLLAGIRNYSVFRRLLNRS